MVGLISRVEIDMILDWHLTCLAYASHLTNLKLLGEEKFLETTSQTFYAPFVFSKEVHKNIKMISEDFIGKNSALTDGSGDLTLADIFIFHELLTLNLIGHNLAKYPEVVAYLQKLAAAHPGLKSTTSVFEAYLLTNGGKFYLTEGYGDIPSKL